MTFQFRLTGILVSTAMLASLFAFATQCILPARNAINDSADQSVMNRTIVALLHYYDDHGHFPPAYTVDENGKRLHSWRVLLLPYLMEDAIYRQIRLDEPWNSAHNTVISRIVPDEYQFSSGRTGGILAFTGQKTAFPGSSVSKADGSREHILFFALAKGMEFNWMEPIDISIDGVPEPTEDRDFTTETIRHYVTNVGFADSIRAYKVESADAITTIGDTLSSRSAKVVPGLLPGL